MNILQAMRKSRPGAKVVTLIVDSGLKYLSTDVFRVDRALGLGPRQG
ncbi:MAG: hypothetical protein ACREJ4_01950 [Candidatus Methylomirabilaceae bacterium]